MGVRLFPEAKEDGVASAASKASVLTTLKVGVVEVPVALFSTVAKPSGVTEFDTAGPNGGVLKARPVARAVPVDVPVERPVEPVRGDPLAGDGLVERLVEPSRELDPLGPGPAMERDTFDAPSALTTGFVTEDPRGMTGSPSGPMLDPSKCGPEAIGDAWERVGESIGADIASREVDGEYGRELYEEGSGVVVAPQDVRRGVRLEDGSFVDCTAELARIDERTRIEKMEVLAFVDITRVPRARVKGTQYIGAADEKAPRALRIVFEGLKATRRGAVVKLTKRTRQTLGIIGWLDGCLALFELVWAEDFRVPPARAKRIQQEAVSDREVEMFKGLVAAMSGPVDVLDSLRDDALGLREDLRARALAGELADAELVDAEVVDPADELAEQLAASLAAVGA